MKKRLVRFIASFILLMGVFLLPSVSGLSCPYVERSNGTYVEYTQFINSTGDGILVLDRNADSVVDAADLFGGRTLTERDVDNAFEDLALLDNDGSGVINSSDSNYAQLKIWRINSTSLELELVFLNQTNVSSINLAYRDRTESDPLFWRVVGNFNSSDFSTLPIAVGVNFTTNLNGNLKEGDFLVLDLDNANNITIANSTECSTPITINLISPANASVESSSSTPSFTFNITDNSPTVNCTLWINSSQTVSSYANNDSVLNATSTTLIANNSLSNGNYYWFISCTDNSTASVNNYNSTMRFLTVNIATSSPSSSSSGSGGGGGSSTQSFWTNTIAEDGIEFSEKGVISKNLSIKHRIRLNISNEQHFVGVISLTNNTVTINVSSTPQQAILNIGESKEFDVNEDGYYDLLIKLNIIAENKANLELNYIPKNIFEENKTKEEQSENIEEVLPAEITENLPKNNKKNLIIIYSSVLLLIIAVVIYKFRSVIQNYTSKSRKK